MDHNRQQPPASTAASPSGSPPPSAAPGAEGLCSGMLPAIAAALAAALLTWAILHLVYPLFHLPEELSHVEMSDPPEVVQRQVAAIKFAERQNGALALGLFGLTLGFSLAAAESLALGRVWRAPLRGFEGGLIGGVTGCAAGWLGLVIEQQLRGYPSFSPMTKTILLQSAALGVLALGVGAAWAVPHRRRAALGNAVLGCVLGAVLAALVYPVAVGLLFPKVDTEMLIPYDTRNRLAWLVTVAGSIALVTAGLRNKSTPIASATSESEEAAEHQD